MKYKSFCIGGKTIKIKFKKNPKLKGKKVRGVWNPYTQEIIVRKGMHIEQLKETLMHEIVEAINSLFELNLKHWKINLLGEMLFQILKKDLWPDVDEGG